MPIVFNKLNEQLRDDSSVIKRISALGQNILLVFLVAMEAQRILQLLDNMEVF